MMMIEHVARGRHCFTTSPSTIITAKDAPICSRQQIHLILLNMMTYVTVIKYYYKWQIRADGEGAAWRDAVMFHDRNILPEVMFHKCNISAG